MNKHAGWAWSLLSIFPCKCHLWDLSSRGRHTSPCKPVRCFQSPLGEALFSCSLLLTFQVGMSRQLGLKSIELTVYDKHGRLWPLSGAFDWWHMHHHALNICEITCICTGKHSKCILDHSSLKAQWGLACIPNTPPTKADLLTHCSCVRWEFSFWVSLY